MLAAAVAYPDTRTSATVPARAVDVVGRRAIARSARRDVIGLEDVSICVARRDTVPIDVPTGGRRASPAVRIRSLPVVNGTMPIGIDDGGGARTSVTVKEGDVEIVIGWLASTGMEAGEAADDGLRETSVAIVDDGTDS